MRMSDWSSDVCSSDLGTGLRDRKPAAGEKRLQLLAIAAIGLAMDRGDGGPGLHEAPEGQPGGEQRRVRYRRAEARRNEGDEAGAGRWAGRVPRPPQRRGDAGGDAAARDGEEVVDAAEKVPQHPRGDAGGGRDRG